MLCGGWGGFEVVKGGIGGQLYFLRKRKKEKKKKMDKKTGKKRNEKKEEEVVLLKKRSQNKRRESSKENFLLDFIGAKFRSFSNPHKFAQRLLRHLLLQVVAPTPRAGFDDFSNHDSCFWFPLKDELPNGERWQRAKTRLLATMC